MATDFAELLWRNSKTAFWTFVIVVAYLLLCGIQARDTELVDRATRCTSDAECCAQSYDPNYCSKENR